MRTDLQRCKDRRKDCVCRHDGFCSALYDTTFGTRGCPFYMNAETKRQVIGECARRLARISGIKKKKGME